MSDLRPLWRGDGAKRPKPEQAIPRLEYYVGLESIHKALDAQDTLLLKSSWLIEQARRLDTVLDSRKDLPEEAFWWKKEMFSAGGELARCIVAVSYPWQTPRHPDPDGRLLRKVADMIKPLKEVLGDCAIFLDWCSLFQEPRTQEEEESYQRSLKDVPMWFLHSRVTKLLCTSLLEDIKGAVSYKDRGWTTFEYHLSFMLSQERFVLDVGLFDAGCQDYKSTVERCQMPCSRPPPTTPSDFIHILQTKRFSKESDRALLERRYQEVFVSWSAGIKELDYQGIEWGDEQIETVAAAIRHCSRLTKLNLAGNRMTNVSAARLAQAVQRCRRLADLQLQGNPIGQAGEKKIVDAWRRARKPEHGLHIVIGQAEQEVVEAGNETEDDGFYYEGMYKNSMRHGHGILVSSGFKYEGSFKKDLLHGYGDASWQDGSRYSGQWAFNQKHGEGEYTSSDGLRYVGSWECGQRSGHGRQEYEDGGYYVGSWCKGLCSGEGKYVFVDGSSYVGLWYSGRYHGPGVMHHKNGVCERSDYKHGLLMTREVCQKTGLPMVAAKIGPTTVTCLGRASIRQFREDIHQPTILPSLQKSQNLISRAADDINLSVPRLRPRSASSQRVHGTDTLKLPLTCR